MRNLSVVTTSWDDGDPKDLKIAGLLSSRNIPGTFYVPTNGYRGRRTLAAEDLKRLSSDGFELGGHTVTHNSLPGLSPEQLEGEVHTCKDNLEQVLGKRVSMFCYPNGRYEQVMKVRAPHACYRSQPSFVPLKCPPPYTPTHIAVPII